MAYGDDVIEVLKAHVEEPFTVELPWRGVSGYEWRPIFDDHELKLLRRRRVARTQSFGGSGKELFSFHPLRTGKLSLRFDLVRPYQPIVAERRGYEVRVSR
jgi:predicted secreted protein